MRHIYLVRIRSVLYEQQMASREFETIKMKYGLIATIALSTLFLASSACSPMRFSRYTGSTSWPIGGGTMAETSYRLPVYRGWPERPYVVLGSLRFEDPNKWWDEGVIKDAVAAAKQQHGEAIVLRNGGEAGVIGLAGALDQQLISSRNDTTALVIRWKTQQELKDEASAREQFLRSVIEKVPQAQQKEGLILILRESFVHQGLNSDSVENERAVISELKRIFDSRKEVAGRYAARVTIRKSSFSTEGVETVFGIVTVNENKGAVAIVSEANRWQLNFSGTLRDGKLSGQLGIESPVGTATAQADGVFVGEKISLTSSSRTADGVFQASVVLIR